MSNWNKTYELRTKSAQRSLEKRIAEINADLLGMPSKFKLEVNEHGRELKLTDR